MLPLPFSLLRRLAAASLFSVSAAFGAIVPGFNTNSLAGNDDGSTGLVDFQFSANFFGTTYTAAFLNNNGNITFNAPLSQFTPSGITAATAPIIAPFFADVDTGVGQLMKYGTGTVGGRAAFGVTWDDVGVGYFNQHVDKLNQFQLLLVDRTDTGAVGNFDIYFNYDQIQWETGDASGGVNGLGGTSARAGYSNGSGSFFELPGSGINGALLDNGPSALIASSNINVPGRWVFEVRNGQITPPTNGVPDTGSTVVLLGAVMLALAAAKRRFC